MRVLILNPASSIGGGGFVKEGRCEQRLSSFQYVMIPISLPSIAGLLLKNNYETKVLDCVLSNPPITAVLDEINRFEPFLIIVNISTVTYYDDINVICAIKSKFAEIHLTGIGNHVTSLPEMVLRESSMDSLILGEPEFTALELTTRLSRGQDLQGQEGVAYRDNDKIIVSRRMHFMDDLDRLPFPARDLMDNEKYTLPVINEPYTLLISSRGCPYDCIFCTAHQYYGKKLRLRSPENILDEIREIRHKYGIKNITMWSDTFTLNREFVLKVCGLLLKEKLDIKWMCNSRVDKVDFEMLSLMKKSGCIGISYGIESGNQQILNNIKKGTTVDQVENAIKWTKQAGIESLAHIIFGLPGEDKDTIKQTIDFIIRINPDYAQFYCAIPFPGTKFYEMCKANDWILTDRWDRFELNQSMISTPQLSADELYKARVTAYRRFYLRPKYLWGRIKKMNSLHDFILLFKQGINFLSSWVLNK